MDAKRLLEAQIALHGAGFSAEEILAMTMTKTRKQRSDIGQPRAKYTTTLDHPRDDAMETLYRQGSTLDEIGQQFNITRERVRQILAKRGLSAKDGGQSITAMATEAIKAHNTKSLRDERAFHFFGCSWREVRELNGGASTSIGGTLARTFITQRNNALRRGIEWKITLPEYKKIWDESGKWAERGRGMNKYCMARNGDEGAYEVGNVSIVTNQVNGRDAQLNHAGEFIQPKWKPREPRRDEMGYTLRTRVARDLVASGTDTVADLAAKMGITYQPAYAYMRTIQRMEPHLVPKPMKSMQKPYRYRPDISKRNPYYVQAGIKYVGVFPTAEEAQEAYDRAIQAANSTGITTGT